MKTYTRIDIRPKIIGINTLLNMSIEEGFQNSTLRPIIKLQHELLLVYIKEYLISNKKRFEEFSSLKKIEILTLIFKNDNSLKTELKGIIIGHFTTDEFFIYCTNKTEYNKRILAMIRQRITSVIDSV
tara:strand:- start:168 stop:551 length:384 start_codon:yes stop_codon:yes gene_type:complete